MFIAEEVYVKSLLASTQGEPPLNIHMFFQRTNPDLFGQSGKFQTFIDCARLAYSIIYKN